MATLPLKRSQYEATPFIRVGVPESQESALKAGLRSVAELAIQLTRADGAAIALALNRKMLVCASAGAIQPKIGARIDSQAAYSNLLRIQTSEMTICADTEADARANSDMCRPMGVRSVIVLPLCRPDSVIGILEAFWRVPSGFTNRDVANLKKMGDLVLRLLKLEEPDQADFTPTQTVNAGTEAKHTEKDGGARRVDPNQIRINSDDLQRTAKTTRPSVHVPKTNAQTQASRIEVTIVSNEAEEDLTAVRVSTALNNEKTRPSPRRYERLVVTILAIFALLTAGIWWKVEASQPQRLSVAAKQSNMSASLANAAPVRPSDAGNFQSTAPVDSTVVVPSLSSIAGAHESQVEGNQITGIHCSSSGAGTTVVVDLLGEPKYQADELKNPDRIFFDLSNTTLSPGIAEQGILANDRLVAKIRMGKTESGARIVLDTNQELDFSVRFEKDPSRLIVDLRPTATPNN